MPREVGEAVVPRGTLGNMANAAAFTANALPGAGGNPCIPFDTASGTPVTLLIKTSATTVLTVYYSPDGVNWYVTTNTLSLTGAVTGTLDIVTAARYIAFASSTNATITATGQAK